MANRITHKEPHKMIGGPLSGHTLYMTSPGTLTFTLKGQTGYYDVKNQWVPKQVDSK